MVVVVDLNKPYNSITLVQEYSYPTEPRGQLLFSLIKNQKCIILLGSTKFIIKGTVIKSTPLFHFHQNKPIDNNVLLSTSTVQANFFSKSLPKSFTT